MPFDLELIAVVLTARRFFDDSPAFDRALMGVFTFLAAVFLIGDLAGDLALTCLFATTFFWALAGRDADLDAGFLDKVFAATGRDTALGAGFLDEVFAVVFTAFLIRAIFATFLATFAVEILLCFDTEAVGRPEEAGFFFSSFFSFEADLEPVLVAATLALVLLLWPLESVSLIPISFCLRGLTLWALRLRVAKWCFYSPLGVTCQFSFGFLWKNGGKICSGPGLILQKELKIQGLLGGKDFD